MEPGSPYCGVQWSDRGIAFFRTSNFGYVRTNGYTPSQPFLVVSISHLAATLDTLKAEEIDLIRDTNGMLRLQAEEEFGVAEVRIHTIRQDQPWYKAHRTGKVARELDPKLFQGVNAKLFPNSLVVYKGSTLMFSTEAAVVRRRNMALPTVYPYPRDHFLRAIQGKEIEKLFLTEEGYWGASWGTNQVMIVGHRQGDPLFDLYSGVETPIATVQARTFMSAMAAARSWSDKNARIQFDARKGVIQTKDERGNPGEFPFGTTPGWPSFGILYVVLDRILDALGQSSEDTIELLRLEWDRLRIRRGDWDVSFAFFS